MTPEKAADPSPGSGQRGAKVAREQRMRVHSKLRRGGAIAAGVTIGLSAVTVIGGPPEMTAGAYPPAPPSPAPSPPPRQNPFPRDAYAGPLPDKPRSDTELIEALPVITPTPSNWAPTFPYPYDQTRGNVTDADITAMREMCQWFNAQYDTLRKQIDRIEINRLGPDGKDFDYSRDDIQQQVDIVTGNLDKALDFLTPRTDSLTQARNNFGDIYFPVYEGEQFFKLHEQLFNVDNGIKGHQAAWFVGPSVQKAKRHGTDIKRSHVCG